MSSQSGRMNTTECILSVELHRSFFIYSFFQEKMLGDISFKLETKIMNFIFQRYPEVVLHFIRNYFFFPYQ
jgi:hypothetical protein